MPPTAVQGDFDISYDSPSRSDYFAGNAESVSERLKADVGDLRTPSTGAGVVRLVGAKKTITVEALAPPVIGQWDAASLRSWQAEYSRYVSAVHAQAMMGYGVALAPIKSMLGPDAVDYCAMFVFRKPMDEISDEELQEKIEETLHDDAEYVDPQALTADLARAWSRIGPLAPVARVRALFTCVFQVFRARGLAWEPDRFV